MSTKDVIDSSQLAARLKDLPHWRRTGDRLAAVFQARSSAEAIELLSDIAGVAEMHNHHPDVDWRYNLIFVSTTSHDVGGRITERDLTLAEKVSEHALALAAVPRLDLIRTVEIGIDTADPDAIARQWIEGLGYTTVEDGMLVDPHNRLPAVWFQQTSTPNPNRLHLDIWVPYSESEAVLERLAGEGAELDRAREPRFVIATDSQGNRFCICTEQGR